MHVLLIHQAFVSVDEPGGTRHHEFALRLAEMGHRVTVLAGQVSYLTGKASGSEGEGLANAVPGEVTVRRCYTYPGWHRSFFHRVISFLSLVLSSFVVGIRVGPVDLVWGTSPPIFQGLSAWGLARLKRAAFLFEVRDLWPSFAVAVGVLKNRTLIRLAEWLERWLYRRADGMVVNSPGFVEHVRSRGARCVELVPNGVDATMFDPSASGARFRRDHSLEGRYLVVYAGAHGISNDLDVLLDAAQRLRDREDISLALVGDGKEKPSLQARAQRDGLIHVHFLPPVAKREMADVLAAADACVAILKPLDAYKTTYPNKVFDYMAAGRPVILAIDGVIRDVVESAQAGLFVPPGDPEAMAGAIQWLVEHREEGRAMGRAGRKHVEENFHRALLAAQLERVMIELVEARK